jgi:hypothetical protein
MVHYSARNGRMRYGTDFTRERPHDRGSPPDQVRGRLAIQHSQESLRVLSKRYGIDQKTVAKWGRRQRPQGGNKRTAVKDLPTGPTDIHSTVLSIEEEAIIVAFRKHTLLPLDDCLYALQATIPHLTRSSLHRCLQRHGISRLPEVTGDKEPKRKFKIYPIGYFHIDIAEVQTAEGKLHLFVAIDRTSKFAFVELHREAGKMIATQFLRNLIAAVPYGIHTVLTDNGIQFTNMAHHNTPSTISSIGSATSTRSNTGSRKSNIPGPTARSNG